MRQYGAVVESAELLMGLTWLAPGTLYPPHAHDAAEVYQMLVGGGKWGPTADLLEPQPPGSFRDHPSAAPHTIKAPANAPMLAWYAWTGDLGGRFWFCDCDVGYDILATIKAVQEL